MGRLSASDALIMQALVPTIRDTSALMLKRPETEDERPSSILLPLSLIDPRKVRKSTDAVIPVLNSESVALSCLY